MRASLSLCYQKGRFLYEVRPDLFPYGFLSMEEILLWERYYRWLDEVKGSK